MTGDWLTLSEAARRISKATGRNMSMDDVLRLGEAARLIVTFEHGYHHVYAQSVVAYLSLLPASELAAHGGDDQTAGPAFTPWTRTEDPDAFDDRATPNDEGDEQ